MLSLVLIVKSHHLFSMHQLSLLLQLDQVEGGKVGTAPLPPGMRRPVWSTRLMGWHQLLGVISIAFYQHGLTALAAGQSERGLMTQHSTGRDGEPQQSAQVCETEACVCWGVSRMPWQNLAPCPSHSAGANSLPGLRPCALLPHHLDSSHCT